MPIEVSVIIVNYNTVRLLPQCLTALRRALGNISHEIIMIDNASRDGSPIEIKGKYPDCTLVENATNVGFGRANNQALLLSHGNFILLINTDAFVAEDAITRSLAYMRQHPRCGILGAKLVGRDGGLQPSARYFPTPWNLFLLRTGFNQIFRSVRLIDDMNWDYATVRSCDWVPGCYYLVRREVIDEVGLFDPRYFLYYEETDHCFAAKRAGWQVVCHPGASVVHLGGESARADGVVTRSGQQNNTLAVESELLYFRKNHGLPGLLSHVTLATIGGAINLCKALLRRRRDFAHAEWQQIALIWSQVRSTRCGLRSTR